MQQTIKENFVVNIPPVVIGYCVGPDCHHPLFAKRGRPQKYCCRKCEHNHWQNTQPDYRENRRHKSKMKYWYNVAVCFARNAVELWETRTIMTTHQQKMAQLAHIAEHSDHWSLRKLIVLCEEWEKGTATAEIGRILECTKNAVCGQAHRLVAKGILVARPSPIKRGEPSETKKASVRRVSPPPSPVVMLLPAVVAPPPVPIKPPVSRPISPPSLCQWPHGDPRKAGFRFCESPIEDHGQSYCREHFAGAYIVFPRRTRFVLED